MRFPIILPALVWSTTISLAILTESCRFMTPLEAPRRLGGKGSSIIIDESIVLERVGDGETVHLSFETKEAASCKLGFYSTAGGSKSTVASNPCASSSATKFSETLTGVPRDQLITIVVKIWPASATETSASVVAIPETAPTAGKESLNLLMVDVNGRRLELTAITNSGTASSVFQKSVGDSPSCALSDATPSEGSHSRAPLLLLAATSRGFINTPATRISSTALAGTFQAVQKQSTEWSLSAKTASGFGQLRIARPTLLASAVFSGRDQSQGSEDSLEDIDAPAIKVGSGSSLVSTWTLDGDGKNSVAVLTIAPSGGFPGITCHAPASSLKITVPPELTSKIPTSGRLWMTLRLDSWQALEKERWAVRVSDWRSMGVQRL